MADELSEREQALRRLPLPYSLALRLRDAGVAADVICQYVEVEQAALDGLYRIAEAKLLAAQKSKRAAPASGTDAAERTGLGRGPGSADRYHRGRRATVPSRQGQAGAQDRD